MRQISVSTEVFAKIWAERRTGEETEDQILARILGCKTSKSESKSDTPRGYHERKFDVSFPEGFEIFRNYKGTDYVAIATKGFWLLKNTGEYHDSLNRLSAAIVDGNENAWVNWKYKDAKGREHLISHLRPTEKVKTRTRPAPENITLEDLGL